MTGTPIAHPDVQERTYDRSADGTDRTDEKLRLYDRPSGSRTERRYDRRAEGTS